MKAKIAFIALLTAMQISSVGEEVTATKTILADKKSIVLVPVGWTVREDDYDGCIGVLTSDGGKRHFHHIVRLPPELPGGIDAKAYAVELYEELTKGDDIVEEGKWVEGESQGGMAYRKTIRAKSELEEGKGKVAVYIMFELKVFSGTAIYSQNSIMGEELGVEMIRVTHLTMNSLKPKE